VTRHGISSPDDLHVSQFGWSAVSPSRPAISQSAGHRGGQGKRAAARSHAQPHLCGEHGEHRRALDLEGRGDQRNASSGWGIGTSASASRNPYGTSGSGSGKPSKSVTATPSIFVILLTCGMGTRLDGLPDGILHGDALRIG